MLAHERSRLVRFISLTKLQRRVFGILFYFILFCCFCFVNPIPHPRGFTVGAFALGGLVGGAVASLVTPLLGRRNTLLYNNAFFVCGGLLMAFATTVAQVPLSSPSVPLSPLLA